MNTKDALRPLQSHDITEERWIPPRTRFYSLNAADEKWARFFGLGHIEHRKKGWYDVRSWEDELLGYTSWDPTKQDSPWLQLPIHAARPLRPRSMEGMNLLNESVTLVKIDLKINQFYVNNQVFLTWTARKIDAEALLRCGWLQALGEDNIDRYSQKLWEQAVRSEMNW